MKWVSQKGHDREGDHFVTYYLCDDGGRVVATVDCPESDEILYTASVASEYGWENERYFLNLEAAKAFCEQRPAAKTDKQIGGEINPETKGFIWSVKQWFHRTFKASGTTRRALH